MIFATSENAIQFKMTFIGTSVLVCLVLFISALLLSEPLLHSWQAPEINNQCVAVSDFADITTVFLNCRGLVFHH